MQTIDIHAHWYPVEWLKLFESDGPKEGAALERTAKGYTVRTERIVNAFTDEFVSLDLRLQGMRRARRIVVGLRQRQAEAGGSPIHHRCRER